MAYKVVSGLFKIQNKYNGKYYVSASKNIKSSYAGIRKKLKNNECSYVDFQKDWDLYGIHGFELIILKETPNVDSKVLRDLKVEYFKKNKEDKLCYNINTNPVNGSITGKGNKHNKKVVCINTGEIFESVAIAHGYNGSCESNISVSCKTKHKTTGKINGIKLCWEYYDNYVNMSEKQITDRIKFANNYSPKTGTKLTDEQKQRMRKPRINKERMVKYSQNDIENKKLKLIDELKRFNNIYGRMPKSRELKSSSGWSSQKTYIKYFGSVPNAWMEAGFKVPDSMKKLIGRHDKLTDEEYINRIKSIVDEYFSEKSNVKIPSCEYIISKDNKISKSGLYRRFGNLQSVLDAMGYTKEFEKKRIELDMIDKYLEIMNILNRTPNSRDIEKFSKNGNRYYSMSSYEDWFGGIHSLQKQLKLNPSISLGKVITKEEVINRLYDLYEEINDVPTQTDISNCEYLPCISSVLSITGFLGIGDLQKSLFGRKYSKVKVTKNGTKCLSQYEYILALVLEKYKYEFDKDALYKNYGISTDRMFTVDFVIKHNEKPYFIEIFGMIGKKEYEHNIKLKIKLCEDNKIPLLQLYPEDFLSMNQNKWNNVIYNFIHEK